MSSIISAENLSKAYRVGKKQERADSLVGLLQESVTAPFQRLRSLRQPTAVEHEKSTINDDIHWALQDVSFEVQAGEVVGIIGRNGAGKSTLLKILSRITEPTSGQVRLRGRVSSLLEVGTGFHPELSGRENVYLNGTILGMTKREIDTKFDEIVDFSGVEKFLDTPVKRFSSGMRVRLAFAVAAFLDPEILIVDEVLAVGDADFQRKCTSRMGHIAGGGRTVLFVSHQIGVIQQLCSKGLYLAGGRIAEFGEINRVVETYNRSQTSETGNWTVKKDYQNHSKCKLLELRIGSERSLPGGIITMGGPVCFTFVLSRKVKEIDISFTIRDSGGNAISNLDSWRRSQEDQLDGDPSDTFECYIPECPLRAGRYTLDVQLNMNRELQDQILGEISFHVEDGVYRGRTFPYPSTPGPVCFDHVWQIR
jgi:lipopolysaccharide transport system ATP-binding protein